MWKLKCFHLLIVQFLINFSNQVPTQSSCGSATTGNINGNTLNRIINGNNAIAGSWPWQVSLRQYFSSSNSVSSHFCGGTLIYENYVLTAAHCVDTLAASQIAVVVGVNDISGSPLASQIFLVSDRYYHADYNSALITNDIAVLRLSSSVTLSSTIALACLPTSSDSSTVNNLNTAITGWGSTDGTRSSSALATVLQEHQMQVINGDSRCNRVSFDSSLIYCILDTTVSSGLSNACFGDSGGPMVYFATSNSKWYVYGVTSFVLVTSSGNCDNTQPSYYTQVPPYITWLDTAFAFIDSGSTQAINHATNISKDYNYLFSSSLLFIALLNFKFKLF